MEVSDIDELIVYVRLLLQRLKPQKAGGLACVVGLYGDLGAGKTTLVQTIAKELGITESVTSPTFVIRKAYDLPPSALFRKLIHIDAYRIEKEEEMTRLDWEDDLASSENLIFIEWADKIENLLPSDTVRIKLTFVNDEVRDIDDGSQ